MTLRNHRSLLAQDIPFVCNPPSDLDCPHILPRRFQVTGSDLHNFAGDYDGIGCE